MACISRAWQLWGGGEGVPVCPRGVLTQLTEHLRGGRVALGWVPEDAEEPAGCL